MKKIYLVLRLIKSIIGINKFNNPHSSYHREAKKLIKTIDALLNLEDAPDIPANIKLKLQWYMAEFLYTCEKFNELSDQRSTSEQRKTYLLSGALVAMCDLIVDDIAMETDQIRLFKKPITADRYSDTIGKLYATLYHSFINSLNQEVKLRVINYYELLFDAQLRSKQQFNPDITREEVDEICKEKCGYSMLFMRAMVKGEISIIEKKAWYELGAFIQYCNDAQDLHKDLQKKLSTFASTRSSLESMAEDIDKQKTIAFTLIKETP